MTPLIMPPQLGANRISENTIPTHHPQIMIARVAEYHLDQIKKMIDKIIKAVHNQNDIEIVTMMKEIVPEFKSQNSVYQKLDSAE